MIEIAPRIWRWTAPHPEWRPQHEWAREVASFALELGDALVLLDPQAPPDGTREADTFWTKLDRLVAGSKGVLVLITIPYHVRSTEAVHERYCRRVSVEVWGHRAAGRRLREGTPLKVIEPGGRLPEAIQAFAIGKPRRQEMPLYLPSQRALAFGDAVVGVAGELRVWEVLGNERRERWYRERFLPTLTPLLELDVDHALVTHGPPAVGDGSAKLARALAADPWHYR